MPSAEEYTGSNGLDSTMRGGNPKARTRCIKPMVNSRSLDKYNYFDVTPVIGRQFENLQVTDILKSEDQVVKDLAITGEF